MVRGPGTWDNDRPPVPGVVGRSGGRRRLRVAPAAEERYVIPAVPAAAPGAAASTDESAAYARLARDGCARVAVAHRRKGWARDDDGDGIRGVHCNTPEGIRAGVRTFLRPFRGVNQVDLGQ